MFKSTPPLQKMLRRLPLSPKQAGKEYYKGNRVGSLGSINNYGQFIPDWEKIRTFVPPVGDWEASPMTPFISSSLPKTTKSGRGKIDTYPKHYTGTSYLEAWKDLGGHDDVSTYEEPQQQKGSRNMPEVKEAEVVGGGERPFTEKDGVKAS